MPSIQSCYLFIQWLGLCSLPCAVYYSILMPASEILAFTVSVCDIVLARFPVLFMPPRELEV